jgi:IMP dehydrogenase
MENPLMFRPRDSYTYADIGLCPNRLSTIRSRKVEAGEIDTSTNFMGIDLAVPIVVAPMAKVVGAEMAVKIQELGGVAVLPRTDDWRADMELFIKAQSLGLKPERTIISLPATNPPGGGGWQERLGRYTFAGVRAFCIDVANGFNVLIADMMKEINSRHDRGLLQFMTGNVASKEGYAFLAEQGIDSVRVGIGGGSVCTTSLATGIGVGQASLIREVANYDQSMLGPAIIADGGIKNPGDVVKALALGADVVMMGGLFAGCEETPGTVVIHEGKKFKHFAGQASMHIKGTEEFVEGADLLVPYRKSVESVWKALVEGLRSGMSYMGARNLKQLSRLPDECFVVLSDAAKTERGVHAR